MLLLDTVPHPLLVSFCLGHTENVYLKLFTRFVSTCLSCFCLSEAVCLPGFSGRDHWIGILQAVPSSSKFVTGFNMFVLIEVNLT